jgi:cellulose synthase/poly-beta-1,6-N-acetylglucosamine synthase-like glycosyltransferase
MYIFIPLFTIKHNVPLREPETEKGITILVPAFNEEKVITNCISGILNLEYSDYEAIIINDGSKDGTLGLLKKQLHLKITSGKLSANRLKHENVTAVYQSSLHPRIFVIDKLNGGKADALNAGIEYATAELIVTLDADSVLKYDALQVVNGTFSEQKILAAGGMVQVGQSIQGSYRNPGISFSLSGLIRFQVIQYMTNFYLHKFTQTKLKSLTVISGAFGVFRKHILLEAGGYRKTVGEDMDITLKIQQLIKTKHRDSKIVFMPQALCYTECPETFRELYGQRIRWQKAFIDCIFRYRTVFFRQLGIRLSLYLLLDSLLLGTVVAFTLFLVPVMLLFNPDYLVIALAFLTTTFILALYQSIAMIIVCGRYNILFHKSDYTRLAFFLPLEIITYRLLGILFVTFGTVTYFINKEKWHVTRRTGNGFRLASDSKAGLDRRAI